MSGATTFTRNNYTPMSTDPNLIQRLNRIFDKQANIPITLAKEYPDRGTQIYRKVRARISNVKENPIITEPSPLKEPVFIDDLLVVLCSFGHSPSRYEAGKKTIELLKEMNPTPKVVLCEGSTDGKWYYDYIRAYDRFDYIPVNLNYPNFINFFCKESLWNHAANTVLAANENIKKLVFLDLDCFFVDRYAFKAIADSLDVYEVVSPHSHSYYTGSSREAKKYTLLSSMGNNIAHHQANSGYQGFSIGMTVAAYENYFCNELPNPALGSGDIFYWYMLTGRRMMRGFRMLPYQEKEMVKYLLPEGIRIGTGGTILGHIDHGPVNERIYKVRCQLMKMAVPVPLSEVARIRDSYILCWANNPQAQDLRYSYERLLIENRREIKITSYEDAAQYYDWLHGRCDKPPKCILPNRFTVTGNKMPMQECAIPVPDFIFNIPKK